ncbi:hypothetical protein BCR41DRAFT_372136 [Lobosporangium transversale]|uniref:DNA topoisomerase (ATP-hydrolyzing) n=1 Tax=Lobosporangium transversale TaxID=64571 RepID=A0A1Y2GK24_9FUNG|nr:hypothetical protein BCR41DRAFT_372136 [Lobosporangium transversale]ORZ11304.1 hypothetical protein BCR41DRAFT_372136 [Lobosporangium transversale]|eukprot:XP_021879619.1 hypothetical protein BCR41DRAFT_372136 [Lobosporangium transversale]
MDLAKALLIGGSPPPVLFVDDPTGAITNITDANYKDTIFEDEWIIAFCSFSSAPCADYFPTYLDAAVTMQNETQTKFAAVWVEENPRLSARFIVPARLPYVIYAKDGDFRHIPYVRNDTQYLITFIEEEKYKFYSVLDGPMGPYSTISSYFVKYAEFMEWVGKYTSWMPKWLIYIIAGSTSGMVFSFFSGGSNYSSDPSKYPHLNPDDKDHLIDLLTKQWTRLDNKVRFILMIISGELQVQNRKKALIVQDMHMKGFTRIQDLDIEVDQAVVPDPGAVKPKVENGNEFDYLLKMAIWSLTHEKVEELKKERDMKNAELKLLIDKSAYDLWNEDLDALMAAWEALLQADIDEANYMGNKGKKPIS